MISIESKIQNLIDFFKNRDEIEAVFIIGSYGTEFQMEDSDIDFAILFNREVDILTELEIEANISDILKFDNIDLVNLKKAPITLQKKTINEGREIYVRDFNRFCDYIEYVYKRFRDEIYFINNFYKDYFYRG
ncbi:type VII toxin-antitoxin system MntA family adenylyltransferase antitoxin [Thermobrachium celere]|uniref:DNA polymerase, beta domain protein region n=1 Tax=Thermobrachium celere DSM 8682 TaxID=941824 RepID=R7RUQ4_9CLOT|nr:nucleotidyltransferase domain-containing protein [Thermobrachium celere]CDF59150.1 DNA polymerase, beta domain protein region [Thermobrachium celere DSM 8682]